MPTPPSTRMRRRKWMLHIAGRPVLGFESESAMDINDEPGGPAFGFVGSEPVYRVIEVISEDED